MRSDTGCEPFVAICDFKSAQKCNLSVRLSDISENKITQNEDSLKNKKVLQVLSKTNQIVF